MIIYLFIFARDYSSNNYMEHHKRNIDIQEITGNHVILGKSSRELMQNIIRKNFIRKPLIDDASVYKQHCNEERVPKRGSSKSVEIPN